jgi:hypothetical protein
VSYEATTEFRAKLLNLLGRGRDFPHGFCRANGYRSAAVRTFFSAAGPRPFGAELGVLNGRLASGGSCPPSMNQGLPSCPLASSRAAALRPGRGHGVAAMVRAGRLPRRRSRLGRKKRWALPPVGAMLPRSLQRTTKGR